jgi:hypothetical protein
MSIIIIIKLTDKMDEDIDIYDDLRFEYEFELVRDLRIKRGEGWRYEELDEEEEEEEDE